MISPGQPSKETSHRAKWKNGAGQVWTMEECKDARRKYGYSRFGKMMRNVNK